MRPALATLGAFLVLASMAAEAMGAPPPPSQLRVDDPQGWRPERSFELAWHNPRLSGGEAVAAVHYRLRHPNGSVAIAATRLPWATEVLERLAVPGPPGVYTADVWLENAKGEVGPPASVPLRFDDTRPGTTHPLPTGVWIGRTAFPLSIRLSRPDGAPPVSGIRGYAVSLARAPHDRPCAAADRCTEAETDLSGGIVDDTYMVADLPEGPTYVGALAVSGAGLASPTLGEAVLLVDKTIPWTSLSGAPRGWTSRPVTLTATATDSGSGMAPGPGGIEPFTAISVDDSPPVAASGSSVTTAVLAEGVHKVAYYARDLAGNVDDGATGNGILNPPPRSATVKIDRTPPTIAFADTQDPTAPELICVRITDSLSGIDGSRGWIGVRQRGSGDPYRALPAVPAPHGELRARWSSEQYPDGEYEFRAVGYDRAGNPSATRLRLDGRAMILSSPLKSGTTLRLGFATGRSGRLRTEPRLTVPSGRGVPVRGRLLAGSVPVASTPVRIVERFRGAPPSASRVSTVTTGADGSFAVSLPAGPSREISAVFAGSETLATATGPVAVLRVRSAVRMRTSARTAKVGGAPLVFAGVVEAAAGTVPPEGKTIELQFRLPGLPWTGFRTIRTDRRGRFRYAYRFSDDDSRGVRFLFRAYAPAQGDWPYEPGGSKPIAVRGR